MSLFILDIKLSRNDVRLAPKVQQAIARGLNEGGDLVRTQVQKSLKTQTNVKAYRSITSRVRTMRAFPGGLSYQIIASGKGIPITEFPVTVTGQGVDAKTWGVDHLFKRSFREKDTGKLRARLGASRFPIRALYGPSLPKELGRGLSAQTFTTTAAEVVPAAILKHLAKALG